MREERRRKGRRAEEVEGEERRSRLMVNDPQVPWGSHVTSGGQ